MKAIKLLFILTFYSFPTVAASENSIEAMLIDRDLSGLKYIHFDMNKYDIKALGGNCSIDICFLEETAKPLTILGQTAQRTQVYLFNDHPFTVELINSIIDLELSIVIENLKISLGSPVINQKRNEFVWFFRNGAALSVKEFNDGTYFVYSSPEYARVAYKNHPLNKISKNLIDPSDF